MIVQNRVTIKPTPGGAIFIDEEGQEHIKIGTSVMYEIGGILETAAGDVTIEFTVELPEEAQSGL